MNVPEIIQAFEANLLTGEEATAAIRKLIEQTERFTEASIKELLERAA